MAKAKLPTLMGLLMMVSGRMGLETDSESNTTKTAQFTEETGKLISKMGRERLSNLMVNRFKPHGNKAKRMARGLSSQLMGRSNKKLSSSATFSSRLMSRTMIAGTLHQLV